jgi:hypothetical protein
MFNSLSHYHVCNPGLPPCLGHDLFEGVVPYDLRLYLEYFVTTKKWFTYSFLNRKIRLFVFRGSESNDRPAYVNEQTGKIVGHAVQVWHLIRFFPLLIGLKIKDTSDSVWQLVVSLRRLVELVCAPVVSYELVAEMKLVIEDYLEGRVSLFQNVKLKPKHHFLSHYPQLTLQLGPLIRLWTLRFESKHSYFKTCIRTAHNFKNITYTLSVKHQLLQALYSAGSLFRSPVVADGSIPFHLELYSSEIREVVLQFPHLKNSVATQTCDSVKINGVEYRKSAFLLTGHDDEGNLQYGEVVMFLIDGCEAEPTGVYVVCRCRKTILAADVGLLEVVDADNGFMCTPLSRLLDPFPLEAYQIGLGRYLVLRHA